VRREVAVDPEPSGPRDHPALTWDSAAGEFLAAWEDGAGKATRIRLASTAPRAVPRTVADASGGAPGYPAVAAGARLVVVAWEAAVAGGGSRVLLRVVEDRGSR
jgi:hypothetical protein